MPLEQPISPMLAKATTKWPEEGHGFEPKWDGFRCVVVKDGAHVELSSRGKKPLTRYFPELVEIAAHLPERCIVDGEIIIRTGQPGAEHLSWDLLGARIHPADSRIQKLSAETPAEIVCFDLLSLGDEDLTSLPYARRRARLEEVFGSELHPSLHLSAMTTDTQRAREWFTRFEGAGLDGVVAKPLDGPYEQGKRAMLKFKHKRTAEAVVVGYRVHKSGAGVGSLLLGLHDDDGILRRVGGIVSFPAAMRLELITQLEPLVLDEADPALESAPSRFSSGRDQSWVPIAPEVVVEVEFDQLEGSRFRHAVTFLRFRPDRDPTSCRLDQVERPVDYDLSEVLRPTQMPASAQ